MGLNIIFTLISRRFLLHIQAALSPITSVRWDATEIYQKQLPQWKRKTCVTSQNPGYRDFSV